MRTLFQFEYFNYRTGQSLSTEYRNEHCVVGGIVLSCDCSKNGDYYRVSNHHRKTEYYEFC